MSTAIVIPSTNDVAATPTASAEIRAERGPLIAVATKLSTIAASDSGSGRIANAIAPMKIAVAARKPANVSAVLSR